MAVHCFLKWMLHATRRVVLAVLGRLCKIIFVLMKSSPPPTCGRVDDDEADGSVSPPSL